MARNDHPCGNCRFYEQSLWHPVGGDTVATLSRSFTRRNLVASEAVYLQGAPNEGAYCVSQGLIAIRSFGPDGDSSLLRLAYPGDVIGFRAFLTGRDHRTEARALVQSRVCVVARRDAKQVVQGCPAVLARLAERFAAELDHCHDRIQDAGRLPNRTRLALLLQKLMQVHGTQSGAVWRMYLPISRQDLADLLGVQPETLSRLMGRLQAEGQIQASGRWIEMPLPDTRLAS